MFGPWTPLKYLHRRWYFKLPATHSAAIPHLWPGFLHAATAIPESTLCLAGAAQSCAWKNKYNCASFPFFPSDCSLWLSCRSMDSTPSVTLPLTTLPFFCYSLILFDTNFINFPPLSIQYTNFLLPHQHDFSLSLFYHITGGLMCLTWKFSLNSPLTQLYLCINPISLHMGSLQLIFLSLLSILLLHVHRSCSLLSGCCPTTNHHCINTGGMKDTILSICIAYLNLLLQLKEKERGGIRRKDFLVWVWLSLYLVLQEDNINSILISTWIRQTSGCCFSMLIICV